MSLTAFNKSGDVENTGRREPELTVMSGFGLIGRELEAFGTSRPKRKNESRASKFGVTSGRFGYSLGSISSCIYCLRQSLNLYLGADIEGREASQGR
jgi:hypothetical protein